MPTMNVSLTREMVDYVESEVRSGDYVSASEVVRDALRAMKDERASDELKLQILRAEIQKGIDEADRGEFSYKTIDEIVADALSEDV